MSPNLYHAGATTMTLSFWAKASTTLGMSTEMTINYGSTGSAASTGIGVKKHSLTTTWTKYTSTFTLPAQTGKTYGGTGAALELHFWFDGGSGFNARTDTLGHQTGTFYIANPKLEYGSTNTPYSYDYADDLRKCSRYAKRLYGNHLFYFGAGQDFGMPFHFEYSDFGGTAPTATWVEGAGVNCTYQSISCFLSMVSVTYRQTALGASQVAGDIFISDQYGF
jgi:hypothetical protein